MEKKETFEKKRRLITAVSAVILSLIICAAVMVILSGYVIAAGRLIPRNAASIDLSGEKVDALKVLRFNSPEYLDLENCGISTDEYNLIREAFPDCDIKWSVPLSSGPVSNKSIELTLSSFSEADIPLIAYFDDLKAVHAEGIDEWEHLSTVEKQYPDIDFNWEVCLNGKYYSVEMIDLILDEPISFSDLLNKLAAFTELKSVSMTNDGLSSDEKLSLQESYPDISFYFTVEEFGKQFRNTTESMDFSENDGIDINRLVQIAPLFKAVKMIDFTGCSYSNDEMYKVMQAFPDADVFCLLELYGKEFSSFDEEIDLSGIEITDTSEIENALPCLKRLTKVVMCKCGVSDEEMDALNKRHDNVKFVWTVILGSAKSGKYSYELRTDTTYFISSLQLGEEKAYKLFDDTAEPLKYCTDMVALDLSHDPITKCEFCRYMPNLRFFVAAGCSLDDISPLADCKELFYLELMFCPVTDLSPLLECKELRHLNISACPTQDSVRPVLSQMTWLERCYMGGRRCYYPSDRDYVFSDEFLPGTEKWLAGLTFYAQWRNHPAYYEMRDALGGAYYNV